MSRNRAGRAAPAVLGVIAGAVVIVAAATVAVMNSGGDRPHNRLIDRDPEIAAVLDGMEIPPFSVTSADGSMLDESVFDGAYTVLSFGFTHCTTACPLMHGNLHTIAQRTAGSGARILTISVDAAHDSPDRLRDYAEQIGADGFEHWRFAVADDATVRSVVIEGLGFSNEIDPTLEIGLPGGGTMLNIIHPTRFLIVGPDRRVTGMYRGTDSGEAAQLASDLLGLIRERPIRG